MNPRLNVEKHAPAGARPGDPPIVMLHGWGMNLRVLDGLRDELQQRTGRGAGGSRETWCIDLPGHGRSPWWSGAGEFIALREALRAVLPPRCVLVGWSLGAKLALALAAVAGPSIAALVLLSATPRFARAADWPHGMDEATLHAFGAALSQDWRQLLDEFVRLQVRGDRDADATAGTLQAALQAQGEPRPEALLAGLAMLASVDLRDVVPRIRVPALVVSGRNDRITPPGAGAWLARNLPGGRWLEIPRAGHAPFLSHRAAVGGAIDAFLAALPGRGAASAPAAAYPAPAPQ